MPVYEYECSECGVKFERLRPMSEADALTLCDCGARARRLISPVVSFIKGPFGEVRGIERNQREINAVLSDTGGYPDWINEAGGT